MKKIIKVHLPEDWCKAQDIIPLITNLDESIEGIVKYGIKIAFFEYEAKNDFPNRKTYAIQEKYNILKSFNINPEFDAKSHSEEIELDIPFDTDLANFLEEYAHKHQMTTGQAIMQFYNRGCDEDYLEKLNSVLHDEP